MSKNQLKHKNRGMYVKGTKKPGQSPGGRLYRGRPTWEESVRKAAEKASMAVAVPLAAATVSKYLEQALGGITDTYILAAGGTLPYKSRGRLKNVPYSEVTNRHAIDRFVPPAPRKIDLGLADTAEDFIAKVNTGYYSKILKEKHPEIELAEIVGEPVKEPEKEGDDVL